MHVVACIRQVLDPEIPPRLFRIDPEAKEAVRGSASLVIGPFDLNALEVAVRLKEACGAKVTALSVGPESAGEALRRALAMGADEAALVCGPLFQQLDAAQAARALARAVEKLGGADLVLCGRQSGDWDLGQVGAFVAEELGACYVPFVPRVEPAGEGLRLYREVEGGYDVLEVAPPVVATVTNGQGNAPRLPKVKDIMLAGRKPLARWGEVDLGLDAQSLGPPRVEVAALFVPEAAGGCELVEGDGDGERGVRLARRLAELRKL